MSAQLPTPDELTIAILTVSRSPQYIHQTLASMFAADETVHRVRHVWIMVGQEDTAYLDRYSHHQRITVCPLSPDEAKMVAEWNIHRRFNHNYHRCLSVLQRESEALSRGIVICEDDIIFRDKFLTRLLVTIHEMESDYSLRDYALALFSAHDFENDRSFYRGRLHCSYGYPFYGTQCMYYPRGTSDTLAAFIDAHGVQVCEEPGDLLVKRLYGNRMYACPRALAQHIGTVSTGLGGCGETTSFKRVYRAITRQEWGSKK